MTNLKKQLPVALLLSALSSSVLASGGDEAETIIKDNNIATTGPITVTPTQIANQKLQSNIGIDVYTPTTQHVNVGGPEIDQSFNGGTFNDGDTKQTVNVGGPEIETIVNTGSTNLTTGPTNVTTGVITGPTNVTTGPTNVTTGPTNITNEGDETELTNEQKQAQEQAQKQAQTQKAESKSASQAINGGQQNSQVTNFEAAAAGSTAHASSVVVPSSCMSGWSFGITGAQVSGSGSLAFQSISPAGVDLGGLTLRDYLSIGENEPDIMKKKQMRFDATPKLSETDQEKLSCLVEAIEMQEDLQDHDKEIMKLDQDFQLFYLYAQHALKNDGPEATTTTIRDENGKTVTTIKEVDEASIHEHAVIMMAIAQRNPELMLWHGAFSEMEVDGSLSATKVVRKYLAEEINYDFKKEANNVIQGMFPKQN